MSRRTSLIAIVLAALPPAVAAQNSGTITTPEQDEVFAFLDRFDARDDSPRPFVKVATGWTHSINSGPWQNSYRFGFLLESNGQQFVVRLVDGNRLRLANTRAGTAEHSRVGFVPADFPTFVRDQLDSLHARQEDRSSDWYYREPKTPLSPETQALVLARTCARLGLRTELQALWNAVPAELRVVPGPGVRGLASLELMSSLDARLWLDLGDPTLSWHDHIVRCEFLIEAFADEHYTEQWAAIRDAAKAHLAIPRADLRKADLTKASVDELIARLVDECRPQESGGFDQWPATPMDSGPAGHSVFDELVRRGLDAVPSLIAHLDDKRLTRSWFYCSRFGGWFEPIKLGGNVRCVLHRIAGSKAGLDTRVDWQGWYDSVREVGLRNHLLVELSNADRNGVRAAASLLERFPESLGTVLDTAEKAVGEHRLSLLRVLVHWAASQPAPDSRLLRELTALTQGQDQAAMCLAAGWLVELGDASGARALVGRWDKDPCPDQNEMRILLGSGDVAVWESIEKHLAAPGVRTALVAGLAELPRSDVLRIADATAAERIGEILRRCLVQLLSDQDVVGAGLVVTMGDRPVTLHVATTADLAAAHLTTWWPGSYCFDPATNRSSRRRQIAALVAGKPATKQSATRADDDGRLPSAEWVPTLAAVEFTAATKEWPTAVRQLARDLTGKPAVADELIAVLVAAAACKVGSRACLHLERAGGATGFEIVADMEPEEPGEESGAASDFDISATASGKNLCATGLGTGGRLDLASFQRRHAEYLGRIRRALERPLDQDVEITLKLRYTK